MEVELLTFFFPLKIQQSLVGSDDSSVDSEDEYVPNPKEESTDSDCTLDLSPKNKKK